MTAPQTLATPPTEDTSEKRPDVTTLLILGGLAVLCGAGLAIAYRAGLQVRDGDPIAYLAMARSIAAGHGANLPYGSGYVASQLTAGGPTSHWPVGYPLLLSLDTHSLLSWARVIAVATYAANVFLFGFLALRTGVARLGTIALAIIFAGLSFALHGAVESEPLFFLFVLVGLHALVSFFNRPAALPILLVAVAFGLSTVTRFLGEAFVIGGALAVLIFLKERFPRRVTLRRCARRRREHPAPHLVQQRAQFSRHVRRSSAHVLRREGNSEQHRRFHRPRHSVDGPAHPDCGDHRHRRAGYRGRVREPNLALASPQRPRQLAHAAVGRCLSSRRHPLRVSGRPPRPARW